MAIQPTAIRREPLRMDAEAQTRIVNELLAMEDETLEALFKVLEKSEVSGKKKLKKLIHEAAELLAVVSRTSQSVIGEVLTQPVD